MDTEVDLTTVDRAVLIAIIAELQAVIERLQRRIAELEGQTKPGDPLRMPGLKAKSARKPPAQQQPRKQRRHGFARPRMTPTHRVEHVMENCPDCGAHLSGGWTQRTREVMSCRWFRCKPSTSTLLGLARPADGAAHLRRYGRRGPGPAAPRRQPAQPDRHAAGRGAATHPQRPVVSGHRASVAPQRGGHRERHSPDRAAGPTSGGRDPGPHPRQPSGPRRRNRLARGRGQWLRVDFQHPHRTLLPAAGSGQGGGGRSAGRVVLRSAGQRFLRCLPPFDGSAAGPSRDIHDQRTRYPKDAALARPVHQL